MAPASFQIVKLIVVFSLLSAICIFLSPIIVSIFVPLLVIAVGSLLMDAQGTVALILQWYHKWNLFKIKYYYKSTPADRSHERLITGQAWNEFCDTLKSAQSAISNGPRDALSQAEGYRFLARTRAALASFLEYADPNVPKLHALVGETIKMGADNPDNLYESAPLLSSVSYKLKGLRGNVKYLSIGTQLGHYGKRMGMPPLSFLDSSQFKYFEEIPAEFVKKYGLSKDDIANEKYFEIVISKEEPSADILEKNNLNYLKLDNQEDGTLIIRQTFGLREVEKKAFIKLETFDMKFDDDGATKTVRRHPKIGRPKALTPLFVDEALTSAASLVNGAGLMFSNWGNRMRADKENVNKLPVMDQSSYMKAGGDPNIFYYHSYYELIEDEALIIKAIIPKKCLFWNFQLNNHWMESLDYSHFPIHINGDKAVYDEENGQKVVYIVVSMDEYVDKTILLPKNLRDCKVNWLSTCYHKKGTMLFRWLRADNYQHPTTEVVKLIMLR